MRLQILYTPIPAKHVDNNGSIINLITNFAGITTWPKDRAPDKDQDTNAMLGLRALSNLFYIKEGRDVLGHEVFKVIIKF